MDLQLEGKHVLISGGSKGIGLACALGFLREGARVSLLSRSEANLLAGTGQLLQALPEASDRIASLAVDLQDANAALAALDQAELRSGPADILVNSAGAARRTAPADLHPQAWHDAMQAKYFTYIHLMDPAIKRMAQRGGGVIVNVVGAGGKVASPIHLPGGPMPR